jgi:hypothetical protein
MAAVDARNGGEATVWRHNEFFWTEKFIAATAMILKRS